MGISISELLLLLLILIVVFGTKRLRTVGSDLGAAIKGFRNSVKEHDAPTLHAEDKTTADAQSGVKQQEKS